MAAIYPVHSPVVTRAYPTESAHAINYDEPLVFHNKNTDQYFSFTPFAQVAFYLEGRSWLTLENYIQAKKFEGFPRVIDAIMKIKSPQEIASFVYDEENARLLDGNWDKKKCEYMYHGLFGKFSQNPVAREELLRTSNKFLIYENGGESTWGIGLDREGNNYLGRLLCNLRTYLRRNPTSKTPPSFKHYDLPENNVATSPHSVSPIILSTSSDPVYFFKETTDYFEFTPYSLHTIVLDDKQWRTVSHYFQAQKFLTRPDIVTRIQQCASAEATWEVAHNRDYVKIIPKSFEDTRDVVMKKAMWAKVDQHESVRRLLRGTGTRRLVFSAEDTHWGIGHDRKGENILGKILMEVRSTLSTMPYKTPEVYKPYSKHPPPVLPSLLPREVFTSTNAIRFFNQKDNLYPLTTFSLFQFRIGDYVYRTLNHYFQAQKFTTSLDLHQSILNAPTASEALKISKDNFERQIPDFNANRLNIMEQGLKARFEQNPSLKELLSETGKKELILDNKSDFYWGIGDGSGKNHFGVLLVKIRAQLNSRALAHLTATPPGKPITDVDTEPIDYPDRPMPLPRLASKHIFLATGCVEPPTSFSADRDSGVILAKDAKGETIASLCDPSIRYPSSLCYDEEHLYVITAPTLVKINKTTGKKVNQTFLPIAQAEVNYTRDGGVRVFDQRSSVAFVYSTDLVKH